MSCLNFNKNFRKKGVKIVEKKLEKNAGQKKRERVEKKTIFSPFFKLFPKFIATFF